MTAQYSSLTISVPASAAEVLSDLLGELGTIGCTMSGEDPVAITAYFEGGHDLDAVERAIRDRLSDVLPTPDDATIERGVVPQADWEVVWRQSLHPIRVGRSWVVHPSWLPSEGFSNRLPLVIDPKMAFGTGTHATTQLCLIELEHLVRPGMAVLDVGTGTGILAIAAAKLGAAPVLGVEIDPEAAECARENVALNDMVGRIQIIAGTVGDAPPPPAGTWHLAVANIEYRTLIAIAPDLRKCLQPRGHAIFSGILQCETHAFVAELRRMGWQPIRVRRQFDSMTDDGWASVVAMSARTA